MDISIIIPHYHDLKNLFVLLNRFENQSLSKEYWEVIVVNNDSILNLTLPEGFSVSYRLKIIEELIPGSYAARNKGILNANGKILGFTDSDCLPDRDWLKNALEHFKKDFKKEIGILTGPVPLFYNNPNQLTDAEVYEKYTGFTTEVYAKEGHAITANWFSYTSVIKEFDGFNAVLKSNGDSELSGKISKKYRIDYSCDIRVMHPARFETIELVKKYKRLLGGTFTRRFQSNHKGFQRHLIKFMWSRYRFAIKKLFSVSLKESWAILKVCHAINKGALEEYYSLIRGGQTKR